MPDRDGTVLVGQLVEDELTLTVDELSGVFAVERRRIVELVEEGVLPALVGEGPRFSGEALRRARLALRMQRDFALDAAGVALVLQLMDRIEALETQLRGAGPRHD